MNNNIVLNVPNLRFEPHLLPDPALPFHFHLDRPCQNSVFNIHENIEFLFFLDGHAQVLCDGTPHGVQAGDIAAINSYAAHQVVTRSEVTYFCLIIDTRFCQYNTIDPTQLCFRPVICDEHAQTLFHRVMDACAGQDEFRYAHIKCCVLELLVYLCRHYATPRTTPLSTDDTALACVCAATKYIRENLSAPLTVDAIANHVGMSRFHFSREFKRLTGLTLTHYINTVRCERARQLLEQGGCKVSQAARQCGFTNDSYFANVFRQYTGMLPSQVRST